MSYYFWQCAGFSNNAIVLMSLLTLASVFMILVIVATISHIIDKRRWRKSPTYAMLKQKGYIR